MVKLDTVKASNKTITHTRPITAVVVGGTSGIGKAAAKALATSHGTTGAGLTVYIVGRNISAAEGIIAECIQACPTGKFTFVKANNLALLSDVKIACGEITRVITDAAVKSTDGGKPAIDILIMSAAIVQFGGRKETTEGLDHSISLLYYSRIYITQQLLPLLLGSRSPVGASVISVYAAGMEDKLFRDDLSLRHHYTFANIRSHSVYMKTLAFERIAEENKGKIRLSHYFPALVITEGFDNVKNFPMWFRIAWAILGPIATLFSVAKEESGNRVLFLASDCFPAYGVNVEGVDKAMSTNGENGGGAYAMNWNDEVLSNAKAYKKFDKEQLKDEVWKHTMAVFGASEAGVPFTG